MKWLVTPSSPMRVPPCRVASLKPYLLLASLLAVSCRAGHAAEVLQQLPPDALGFAVIRDIGATDGKLQQLAAALQLRTLGPLEFLRTATGIGEGLDPDGEFMLAVDSERREPRPDEVLRLVADDRLRTVAGIAWQRSRRRELLRSRLPARIC